MATHARAGLEDVYTWMHIADADNLIHVHVVVTTDAAQLIGESDIHGTIGILHHLSHFSSTNVGNDDFALAERGIVLLHPLAHLATVGTNGAVVV